MHDLDLEAIDRDGAFRETFSDAAGLTRNGALRAAIAGFGGAAFLGGLTASSAAAATPSRANDVKILNFALTFERLGVHYYSEAIDRGALSGEALTFAKTTLRDEKAHVTAVAAQIRKQGGKVARSPTFDFGSVTSKRSSFLSTSSKLEQLCVEALNGAGPLVTKSTLAAAGMLVSVEARQVSWVRLILGQEDPVKATFDNSRTLASVRKAAASTGFVHPLGKTPKLS